MSPWGWIRNVYQLRQDDILRMAGTDALVLLEFVRLMSISLFVIAVPSCLVLVPVDVTYTDPSKEASKTGTGSSQQGINHKDKLLSATIGHVDGPRLWAHVTLSYFATLVVLGCIYYSYRKIIGLRQNYFGSVEYQNSYFSRTLMLTDIAPDIVTDSALRGALESTHSSYKFCEVQLGMSMNNLPDLLAQHKQVVLHLERALDKALRKNLQYRPMAVLHKRWYHCGGVKVDAIEHYSRELETIERQIISARSDAEMTLPETFGFTSLANTSYAHAAARYFSKFKPKDFSVRLAPRPSDIIWSNLTMGYKERQKSRWFARFLLVLLFLLNTIPMLLAALVSNLQAFSTLSDFIYRWKDSISFATVTGIVPPLISFAAALLLPRIMRKIIIYRGVRTKQTRDLLLTRQYFVFLVLTQFVLFSLISVFLELALLIKSSIQKKQSADDAITDIITGVLAAVTHRFEQLSSYWMTWIVLRGYLLLFELAQIQRLLFLLINRYFLPHTPRDIWEFKKPQLFSYWMVYADLLLLSAIGLIYAPLAPIVTAFAAGVFALAYFVYKNQLYYVSVTKSETGGRLWSVVVKCLLTLLACMQIILALIVGLLQNWIKTIVCIPPILFVVAFGLYCQFKMEPQFRWYIPTSMTSDAMKKFVRQSEHQRLERQFGNPYLHQPLSRPIINAQYMQMVKQVYQGPVVSSKCTADDLAPKGPILPIYETASVKSLGMDDVDLKYDLPRTSSEEAFEMDLFPSTEDAGDTDLPNSFSDPGETKPVQWQGLSPSAPATFEKSADHGALQATNSSDSTPLSLQPRQGLAPPSSEPAKSVSISSESLLEENSEYNVIQEYAYEPSTDSLSTRSTKARGYRPLPNLPI
ncbi:hypothetical protein MNAN1_002739 [Malassezia nana]|uniref:DUF221-domain-containing protein n=1 Tax=Malassezia nana TaxID=180528 RepID=A0AAF0EN90_9BASI|nr:hypothetical protein MNAN1_002739 [Malassezia nana]